MAAQLLHKSTKQDVHRYQACWQINNFSTLCPNPELLAKKQQKSEEDLCTGTGKGRKSRPRIKPCPVHGGPDKTASAAQQPQSRQGGFLDRIAAFFQIGNRNRIAPNPVPLPLSEADANLTSPEFKFVVGNKKGNITATLILYAVGCDIDQPETRIDGQGLGRLSLQTTIFWAKKDHNELWRGKVEIQLVDQNGEVLATPPESAGTLLPSPNKMVPAYHANVCISDAVASIWNQPSRHALDTTLRIRLHLTIFGKIRHTKIAKLGLPQSGTEGDVILNCGGLQFHAHCAVLTGKSRLLAGLLETASLNASGKKEITLQKEDVEPQILAAILQYMYGLAALKPPNWTRDLAGWLFRIKAAARYFGMDELEAACEARETVYTRTQRLIDIFTHPTLIG